MPHLILALCAVDVFAWLKIEAPIFAFWANCETDTLNNFNPRRSTSPTNGQSNLFSALDVCPQ
ncbi:hypothetical protein EN914_15570 [Mesorhizobium sp. M7A.F.Ca.CA.001.08.2.1]|nr:hypothetical protein EN914_15570 [Mesorhizobium sp. M7A.F.Ca.CA.001.08.2.1]